MIYNTRIAPSPTGEMHLGTMRTAYFNWLAARASGGKFIVRIDDTDAKRNQSEISKTIFTAIGWFGLDWDKEFCQSSRVNWYKNYAEVMLRDRLAIQLSNGAIAICKPNLPGVWDDEIAGFIPITATNYSQIDERLILIRGDGSPTYQLASVVDDWEYNINYIIRGTDHISNTPKQIAIWHALNKCFPDRSKPLPKFAHVGLLFKNNKKLSKRDSSFSLSQYADYNPKALLNFLLRLGWSPYEDNKDNSLISKERAIEMFLTQGRMRNSQANVDEQKLKWFDKKYTRR